MSTLYKMDIYSIQGKNVLFALLFNQEHWSTCTQIQFVNIYSLAKFNTQEVDKLLIVIKFSSSL